MKAFRFSLDRILHWRETQFEQERAVGERLVRQRLELDASAVRLTEARTTEEHALATAPEMESSPLLSMSGFQLRIEREKAALGAQRAALDRAIANQLAKTMEARRRVRLLERLRDKRKAEWTAESQAEQERFASETWLGRIKSRHTGA